MNDISKISMMCSFIGYLILGGNVSAVKFLYGTAWREHPALIKTIDELQRHLTTAEILGDTRGIYGMEFLYHWGMVCLGELSPLIFKDLKAARVCFEKIKPSVPQAEARLAYIELLESTEPAKDHRNICCLEELRKCASKQRDLFSMIVLAKICFHSFLEEQQQRNPDAPIIELPLKATRLLEYPIQQGHPVAIRFWNDMVNCLECPPEIRPPYCAEKSICQPVLYDLKSSASMQIRP